MKGVIAAVGDCLASCGEVRVPHERSYPEIAPRLVPADGLPLHPALANHLRRELPGGLFSHQRAALQAILAGRHAVLSTATASGKSLVFMAAALQAYLAEPAATCLFVYPQKALENDQLEKMQGMYRAVTGRPPPARLIARYDGATPDARKPAIRRNARFVLTNPDMLHYALLQYHGAHWSRFFDGLRCVTIDEAHAYRGIFGSSVAYILRRLRAVCCMHRSAPVFVAASATIDRPAAHLRGLTGLDFAEVGPEQDGSRRGAKHLWLVAGTKHFHETGRDLLCAFVRRGLSCLAFCPSRTSAERMLADLPPTAFAGGRIRVYRAGLSAAEREEIEQGIQRGTVKGVFSTSALELGIDIGALDVVLCIGLPGTMMSLRQRAGRVGRGGREGAVVFVAADRPLDAHFLEHPDELFGRRNEPLALNLRNRRLVCGHLACAVREAGGEESLDAGLLGEPMRQALARMREGQLSDDVLRSSNPHMQVPIRNGGPRNYRVLVGGREEIGEIDPWHMLREAYPKAIYLHGGRRLRVRDISTGRMEVRVEPERSANSTTPSILKRVHTCEVVAAVRYRGVVVAKARFDVTERLMQVSERNRSGKTVALYAGSQGLPPHRLPTEGISIEALPDVTARAAAATARGGWPSAARVIERLIAGLFPAVAGPCDAADYGTACEVRDGRTVWYLYDQVDGGIGLAIQAYDRVPDLLAKALERVTACPCRDDSGCFRCVRDPDTEEVVSKSACAAALAILCEGLRGEPPTREEFAVNVFSDVDVHILCCLCGARLDAGADFCGACGERVPYP